MAVGQMAGEIIRPQHRHHAMRLVAEAGGAEIGCGGAGAGAFGLCADRDGDLAGHAGGLGAGFPEWFAGFAGDDPGQRLGLGLEVFGVALRDGDARLQPGLRPCGQHRAGAGHGGVDLGGGGGWAFPHGLAGGRIDG